MRSVLTGQQGSKRGAGVRFLWGVWIGVASKNDGDGDDDAAIAARKKKATTTVESCWETAAHLICLAGMGSVVG